MRFLRGGFAGLVATAIMTVVIFGAKAAGFLRTPPPKQITKNVEESSGVNPHAMPRPAFGASWLAAHAGYGAASGILFMILRPLFPSAAIPSGLIYGGALWAAGYLGILPALGLYPPPEKDASSRTAVMIVAHAVYGTVLAEAIDRS